MNVLIRDLDDETVEALKRRASERNRSLQAELKAINAHLEALATTDGLTGLQNHRAMQERLREEYDRALRYNTPLSVLMVDVDKFKVTGTIQTGKWPCRLAVTPDSKSLVYALQTTEAVGFADLASKKEVAQVPLGGKLLSYEIR